MPSLPAPDLGFDDMLSLIEDRSAALRAAAAEAGLDARVPGCPDWSVRDLAAHLGEVQLFWSAAVAAGPADKPPAEEQIGDREPQGELLTWSARATAALVLALREAGPDRGCWTWWQSSGAPMTAGAVARHQVQEAAVHAFDAQQAAGHGEPLPPLAAADGVGEYLAVGLASMGPWPHEPAPVLLEAGDGGRWLVGLGPAGARSSQLTAAQADVVEAAVTVTASPSDLVLALYRREAHAGPQVTGDLEVFDQLLAWPDLD
jgi:uncharacterized protein (TIGR03083 family)